MELTVLENIGYTQENGLVICKNHSKDLHTSEWYHIVDKAKRLEVDAVLFRRYFDAKNNHINSKPSVYIFQREDSFFNTQEHKDLHAKLWSAGEIDVYVILGQTRLDIVNARRPADSESSNGLDLESLKLVSESITQFNDYRFSAHIFGIGTFWEQKEFDNQGNQKFYLNKLDEKNAPFHKLLEYLKDTRKTLKEDKQKNKLSEETIDNLLIICILIKYLEGIEDDEGKNTLTEIYQNVGIEKFEEALENGKTVLAIFENLASEFNGKIFDIFTEAQKQEILQKKLSPIADFLTGKINTQTKQIFIWEQYNFNFLPIELISAIYESFLPKSKGVVYTPPFLVDFLVDEVMPLDKAKDYFTNDTFKVLDPSCGSGVFLVATYKRMLEWWSINHYHKTGEVKFPDKNTCQSILEKNIFGVDIQGTATLISIFSLTIALLNKLLPKEIWNGLKFKDLQQNIKTQDFFNWAISAPKDFDLAIGNPPFNKGNQTANANIKLSEEQIKGLNLAHYEKKGNKLALLFFEGAMTLARKSCLIIPSNVLLYSNDSQEYRKQIFTDFNVSKIYDFTHLLECLFVKKGQGSSKEAKKGRTPVCTVIAESRPSRYENIEHIIIHRLVDAEKKIVFQIDYYDRHLVRWDIATNDNKQFVWKCNLLGSGRLFNLIDRLDMLEKLGTYLGNKVKNNKWTFSSGYRVEYKSQKVKSVKANFITDKNTIKADSFDREGNYISIKESADLFAAPRVKELYEAPHIIFNLVLAGDKIPMAFVDEYLCFNSSFIGISAPRKDKKELYQIYERLHKNKILHKLYSAYILATSSKALVYRGNIIVKEDIDNLPYHENEEYLYPSKTEEIIIDDILKFYRHLWKSANKDAKPIYQKVTSIQLKNYGQIFCKTLNEEHDHAEENRFWQIGEVLEINEFIAYQFLFGKEKEHNDFQIKSENWQELEKLIFNTEENKSTVFTRVIRYYGNSEDYDVVWLVKPNTMRYWLNSIALRDADDTFKDYFEVGY